MVKYKLTERVYNTLVGRGYDLRCKICGMALRMGDEIESKPSKYHNRKFYHERCYENSLLDFGLDNIESEEDKELAMNLGLDLDDIENDTY